ncbi:hypothetical protein CH296_27565 [Rhodococcus sp. 14-2496-1d]|nr:hypothetical protein CH296_27565 [Rhodococcus sp. 14-2496-1d]
MQSGGARSAHPTAERRTRDSPGRQCRRRRCDSGEPTGARDRSGGSVAKIVKLEHAWRRLDGRNDDGFQVAPFPG